MGGEVVDLLQTDRDVLAWLERAGLLVPGFAPNIAPLSLLRDARVLRENIRLLVEKRKAGHRGDPSVLNSFLEYAQSHPRLVWKKPQLLTIERVVRQQEPPESILAPVAEAAATLLATADFKLVKRCEGEMCVLWFSDQTKSHHRRWCSTKICGNRHKVAAYRKRHRDHVMASRA
jgi:predicted RNA-binding Zn ribbon-like protein